jgi:hypothetical protein
LRPQQRRPDFVRGLYLVDDDRLREIMTRPEAVAELTADQERQARWAAKREKRSKAARKGWSRYDLFFEEQRNYRARELLNRSR